MIRVAALMAGLCLILGGCMASKVVVTVNKDGSGMIEQTAYWSSDLDTEMGPDGTPKPGAKDKPVDVVEMKKKLDEVATKLGEGVTCKSLVALAKDKEGRNGAKASYAFTDINKVKCPVMLPIGPMAQMGGGESDDVVKFQYADGKLTITSPPPKKNEQEDKPKTPQEEAMEDQMMAKMFKGAVIEFSVAVNGTISKTNAKNVNKNQVDIMVMDLDGLSKDAEAMKAMKATSKLKDEAAQKKAYSSPPLNKYMKMELEDKITVEFK